MIGGPPPDHFKKRPARRGAQRPDVLKQRQAWFGAPRLDPGLVFIDETGASTNLARRTLPARATAGSFTIASRCPGLRLSGLVAQKAFHKPMNAATFEDWVEKCLVPTLSKGDVVVMDNLSSHKGPRVERTHHRRRSAVALSAALQSRYEPHRKSLLQTEGLPAQNRRAHRRGPDERSRRLRRYLQTRRMRKLLQGLRI